MDLLARLTTWIASRPPGPVRVVSLSKSDGGPLGTVADGAPGELAQAALAMVLDDAREVDERGKYALIHVESDERIRFTISPGLDARSVSTRPAEDPTTEGLVTQLMGHVQYLTEALALSQQATAQQTAELVTGLRAELRAHEGRWSSLLEAQSQIAQQLGAQKATEIEMEHKHGLQDQALRAMIKIAPFVALKYLPEAASAVAELGEELDREEAAKAAEAS